MFSKELKHEIAEKVQKILQDTIHPELPRGEIDFILHVDGATMMSWANIGNNGKQLQFTDIPNSIIGNMNRK